MKKNKITKYNTLDEAREAIEYLTEKKQKIENQIKINQILKDNNTRTLDDIDSMTPSTDKALLTYNGNEPNTSYDSCIPVMLPKAPTKIVEIKHKNINQGELFKIAVLEDTNIDELVRFNITKPTEEDLSHIRYNASLHIDYEYINSIPENSRLVEIQKLRKEQADKITHTEALNIYYKNEIHLFNEEIKKEYLRNLSRQEVHVHYQRNIDKLYEDLEQISNLIFQIQNKNSGSQLSLLQSPSHLYSGTQGLEKKEKLSKVFNTNNIDFNAIHLMFKHTAPDVYHKIEESKENESNQHTIKNYIKENQEQILNYIIGAKLNNLEDMIFNAFRFLAIRVYQLGQVDLPYRKITIKTSDLYKLCNVTQKTRSVYDTKRGVYDTKLDGYDTRQKRKIKEYLKQESNLLKRLFYEIDNSFITTSFIKYLYWNDDNTVTFEIDSMFFVNEENLSYFSEDIEGRNRLISRMPTSKPAYILHKYLSYSLKSAKQEFNVNTLLEQSGLNKSYDNHPERTLQNLQKILDVMFEEKTIIKDKPTIIFSGSDAKGKYCLVNLKYQEIKIAKREKKKNKKIKLAVSN